MNERNTTFGNNWGARARPAPIAATGLQAVFTGYHKYEPVPKFSQNRQILKELRISYKFLLLQLQPVTENLR